MLQKKKASEIVKALRMMTRHFAFLSFLDCIDRVASIDLQRFANIKKRENSVVSNYYIKNLQRVDIKKKKHLGSSSKQIERC